LSYLSGRSDDPVPPAAARYVAVEPEQHARTGFVQGLQLAQVDCDGLTWGASDLVDLRLERRYRGAAQHPAQRQCGCPAGCPEFYSQPVMTVV
jgi:hypothetical protein